MAGIEAQARYNNLGTLGGYRVVLNFYAKAVEIGQSDEARRLLEILERSEFSDRLKSDLRKLGL